MSTNGHPNCNCLKDNTKWLCMQHEATPPSKKRNKNTKKNPDEDVQKSVRRWLLRIGVVVATGVLTGLGEVVGSHLNHVTALFSTNPATASGLGGVALGGAAACRRGRLAIAGTLRALAALLEPRIMLAIGLLAVTTLSACADDELDARFKLVRLGLTEAAAVAVMRTPPTSRIESATFAGIVLVKLTWRDGHGNRIYVVRLIGTHRLDEPRVVERKTCAGTATC